MPAAYPVKRGKKICLRGHKYDASAPGCIKCSRAAQKARYHHDPAVRTEALRATKDWSLRNKERLAEYARRYYQLNKARLGAVRRARCLANPGPTSEYNRLWAQRNKERVLENGRKWAQNNPDKARLLRARKNHNRRARVYGLPFRSRLTSDEWLSLRRKYKFRCAYCLKKKPLVIEHVKALVDGGHHKLSNVVPSCVSCNVRKEQDRRKGIQWVPKSPFSLTQ